MNIIRKITKLFIYDTRGLAITMVAKENELHFNKNGFTMKTSKENIASGYTALMSGSYR